MPNPKKRTSRSVRNMRRSGCWKLKKPGLSECSHCHKLKLPHRVCPFCGYYNNKPVVKVEES